MRERDKGSYLGLISRRDLLRTGAALGVFTSAIAAAPRPARAQTLEGPVPEVDSLAVRVVTDSYHHAFEPARTLPGLTVQRYAFEVSRDKPPRRTLQNEWGLALHAESRQGESTRQVMIDFGYTPEALNNNLDILGVDPGKIDAILLTHGHYDHFGGMNGFLARHKGQLKKDLPFYLGGEECFCTREVGPTNTPANFGALDRDAIADAGLKVLYADRPSLIADHGFTTGRIDAASFERVLYPSRMKPGYANGVGCRPEALTEAKRNVAVVPDDYEHEQATCFVVKGKGLVVMTSCGHRGIVNSVRRAIAVSGVSKVHAVLGGFHLAVYPSDYQRETVLALKEINPSYLIPMHCTGEAFIALANQEMPGKLIRSSTGSRFVFA